jgi:NAD(P)-dependent dehydrogenase (short-subunit alcohol dehydrogenase family)
MGQIDSLAAMMKKEHGKLDILVNNAATNPYFGNMDGIDLPRWDKTFDVNLKGPFFLIQKTIDLLAASGKGSVINVSSISGKRPGPFQGVYSITKAAMISMTQGFAKELGLKSIRVNALLPGMTKTRFSAALMENEELLKAVYKMIPLGRHALPDEMAGAALYLASDASSYTTGTCLTCDGGFLA